MFGTNLRSTSLVRYSRFLLLMSAFAPLAVVTAKGYLSDYGLLIVLNHQRVPTKSIPLACGLVGTLWLEYSCARLSRGPMDFLTKRRQKLHFCA